MDTWRLCHSSVIAARWCFFVTTDPSKSRWGRREEEGGASAEVEKALLTAAVGREPVSRLEARALALAFLRASALRASCVKTNSRSFLLRKDNRWVLPSSQNTSRPVGVRLQRRRWMAVSWW